MIHRAHGFHVGPLPDRVDEARVVRREDRCLELRRRRLQRDVRLRPEAEVDGHHSVEALDHERRAGDEYERERDFDADQPVTAASREGRARAAVAAGQRT